MFKLTFYSEPTVSIYPVDKETETYAKVRKTTVLYERYGDKSKKLLERKTATVVQNPNEPDLPALGQKYAVSKLTQQLRNRKIRTEVWERFADKSRAASRVMGRA
ncbi:MAG: hypothetical protein H8D23_10855 [Candidatus Brocadiales bacterium]|nr:hypothetical protein [Candidatus Brocadiales bacterium]